MDQSDIIVIKNFSDLSINELYDILHARQEVFAIEQKILYQDLDYIDQNSIHLFITDNSNDKKCKLKAYLRIIKPGVKYPEASIGRVLTLKEYRGSGLGREIMEAGIKEAVKKFGIPIKIEAQEYLRDFYISLGFEPISEPFILEGISHIEMILNKES